MATALSHLDPKQKQRLTRRAKKQGKSFSHEVRNAVDTYLDVSAEDQAQLKLLARAANESVDRTIKNWTKQLRMWTAP